MVGSVMKYFRMSYKEVTQERSYINILLLNSSIPTYKKIRRDKNGKEIENPKHARDFFMNFVKH